MHISPKRAPLYLYGFGNAGAFVAEKLLGAGQPIAGIFDQGKAGQTYRDIPIQALDQVDPLSLQGAECLVTLHNNHADLQAISQALAKLPFAQVHSLVRAQAICPQIQSVPYAYWLDFDFDYAARQPDIDAVTALLTDEKSRALFKQMVGYRQSGVLADCPVPSTRDEYVPADLPRHPKHLRVIDCGAYHGTVIEKLMKHDYQIDALLALEPDAENFAALVGKNFSIAEAFYLPVGAWSQTTQLRFRNEGSMGSALDPQGDQVIQCVRIDEVARNFAPNWIKFDIEGAEIEALKGLEQTIRTHRPHLCISLYHTPGHLFDIPLLIAGLNLDYDLHMRVHEQHMFGTVLYAIPR